MNDLICKLEKSHLGCWVSSLFADSVLYADDIMLVNASVWKLQLILNICNEFANDYGLTFSAKKSVCIIFGKRLSKPDMPKMFIGESEVMWSNDCSYLGIMLCNGKYFSCSIDDHRRKFCASVNTVFSKCNMSKEVVLHVVQMQCPPI